MTRRRSAWVAAVAAILLVASYLLVKQRRGLPATVAPTSPASRPVLVDPAPAAVEPEPEPTVEVPVAPVQAVKAGKPEPRSWGGSRAVPPRTPPPAPGGAGGISGDVEEPLPTWVRVAIVAGALVAFFAVSLIATKQV